MDLSAHATDSPELRVPCGKEPAMNEWSATYPYTEINVRAYVPPKGGVYQLLSRNGQAYCVFYVGESKNLQWRLLHHLGPNESDVCIKMVVRDHSCLFRSIEVPSPSEKARIKKQEIKKCKPPCNG